MAASGASGSSYQPPLAASHDGRDRSPAAWRELSPIRGSRGLQMVGSSSASVLSPRNFTRIGYTAGDAQAQTWTVPAWAALTSPRAVSPLQQTRYSRSPSPMNHAPAAPGAPLTAVSPMLPSRGTLNPRSPVPSPLQTGRDLSASYSSVRVSSPQPMFRNIKSGDRSIKSTTAPAQNQRHSRGALAATAPPAQVGRALPTRPIQTQDWKSRYSSHLMMAQRAIQRSSAKDQSGANEVHEGDEPRTNGAPKKDANIPGFPTRPFTVKSHERLNGTWLPVNPPSFHERTRLAVQPTSPPVWRMEAQASPLEEVRLDGTEETDVAVHEVSISTKQNQQSPKPVPAQELHHQFPVDMGGSLEIVEEVHSEHSLPSTRTLQFTKREDQEDVPGKLLPSPTQEKKEIAIGRPDFQNSVMPVERRLQISEEKLVSLESENLRLTEQALRSKLREAEEENAALQLKYSESQCHVAAIEQQFGSLRRDCEAAKQERREAEKSIRDAKHECQVFQKRWIEAQGKLDVATSEWDVLRERKDQAESMLSATVERWEADQRKLVEAEKRIAEFENDKRIRELTSGPEPIAANLSLGGKREDPSPETAPSSDGTTDPGVACARGKDIHGLVGLWLCRALGRMSKKPLAAGFYALETNSYAAKVRGPAVDDYSDERWI